MRLMICGLISLSLFLINGCGDKEAEQGGSKAAPVHVASVIQATLPRIIHAVGNVKASATVGIVPRVSGEIIAVNFKEGQEVKEGQPLVLIDPRPFEAVLREKRGLLAKSEAQLGKAQEDRRRYGKLVGNGYVSREAFEQTATDAAALRATVQSDRAAVESAELDLSYCNLSAPISGRIGALNVDKGNMVKNTDSSPIVTIDTISPCYVTFSVAESYLPALIDYMAQHPVVLTATPTGGVAENGQLTLIDNNVDVKTGTIRLRATFKNDDRRLWPGQFVEVRLPLGNVDNALVIPSRAVQTGRDESYVYVVDEDGTASYRKVEPLFEDAGKTAISGDIKPGDRVVVEGQVRLAPGLPVKIME